MIDNLMKLSELGTLLEYCDERSTTKWCKKNGVLILHVGKAKYVAASQVNSFFENHFKAFMYKNYINSKQIIDANNIGDKLELSHQIGAPVEACIKQKYKAKTQHSKASQDLINNLKRTA